MSKTYKDKPEKYKESPTRPRKAKEGKRFVTSKGRKNKPLKNNLDDYFI